MIRFLHTGDWQLGMTRHFLSEGAHQALNAGILLEFIKVQEGTQISLGHDGTGGLDDPHVVNAVLTFC